MDGNYLTNPLIFLVQVLFGGYGLLVLLRFLLQLVRADFYNPVSQFVARFTSPVLRPMRRYIPGIAGLDVSALVLLWVLKVVELTLVVLLAGAGFHLFGALFWALPELVGVVINFYLIVILILVVASWINPGGYNPALALLERLSEPLMRPLRSLIPPVSGLDLSPMVALVGLYLLEMLLLPPLRYLTGSPF
jgi:YggT family protein